MTTYTERLKQVIDSLGRLCVGIDPHDSILTEHGFALTPQGLEAFSRSVVEQLATTAAVFKPQSAFFERFGSAGVAVLSKVLADIRSAGALAILDVKRGDIGSTLSAYAHAYLDGSSDLAADAITISPFLGVDALQPALELAHKNGRGVYVLCRTSNPRSETVQLASAPDGTVAQSIVDFVTAFNADTHDSSAGLVIGATLSTLDVDLASFDGSILAPGIGAQGAAMTDLPALFGKSLPQVLPTVSRGVLAYDDTVTMRQRAEGFIDDAARALSLRS